MRNLLALVGLAVVAFAGAGWYLGWYKIGKQEDAQGHPQLQIQVNPTQVKEDLDKLKHKIEDAVETHQVPAPPAPGQSGQIPSLPPIPTAPSTPTLPAFPTPASTPQIPGSSGLPQPPSMPQPPSAPVDSWIYVPR